MNSSRAKYGGGSGSCGCDKTVRGMEYVYHPIEPSQWLWHIMNKATYAGSTYKAATTTLTHQHVREGKLPKIGTIRARSTVVSTRKVGRKKRTVQMAEGGLFRRE